MKLERKEFEVRKSCVDRLIMQVNVIVDDIYLMFECIVVNNVVF